jgi:signal transduction histidine kinase
LQELLQLGEVGLSAQYRMSLRLEDGAPRQVDVDPNLLRAAFENLINNACQAMPQGGTVEIRITAEDRDGVEGAAIEVSDSGQGMDAATLARALDPFFTTRPSGTGLGLPIVQRIVGAHGGALRLDSTPGHGTRALVWLPLHAAEGPSSRSASSSARPLTTARA